MRFTILLFITFLCLKGFSQTFNLDPTFAPNSGGPNLGFGPNGVIYTSAVQPDGKIIIAGNFTSYDGVSRKTIARLHPNGNIDTTFVSAFESFNTIRHIEILSNGKILVTGNIYEIGSVDLPSNSKAIARLNSDGTKDLSFNQVLPSAAFNGCKELANGKIIVYGSFTYINGNGNPYNKIGRLNSDGSLDLTFYQSSGGNYGVLDVIELPNEQLVAVGDFTQFDGSYFSGIVRLNSNGSVDGTFISPGSNLFNENRFKSVMVQSDGKYIAAGRVISSTGYQNVYRFNTDGTLDLTFYSNGTYYQQIEDCAIQNDDKIILSGYINDYDGQIVKHIFRINADGTFDPSFQANTKFDAQVDDIHLLSGDTLIVTGYFSKFGANRKMRIAKLDPNGNSLDNFPNIEGFDLSVKEIKIQSDDKVVVVGAFSYFENTPSNGIIRLTQNGEFDSTFLVGDGANDAVNSLFLQSDGKIIIGGKFTTYNNAPSNYLIRINSDGSIDNTFNVSIDNEITKIFPQPDGRFIIIGNFTMVNGVSRVRIARMLPNWTLDLSFNPGTGFNGTVNLIDVNTIGKILVGGNFTSYNGLSVPYITMLNSNGSLDNQFSSPFVSAPEYLKFHTDTSWFITNGTTVLLTYGNFSSLPQFQSNIDQQMFIHKITGVLKLPDDRFIFHGHFQYIDENGINQNLSIIRTDSSFVRETGFESNYFGEIYSSALQSNGKLICGGNFTGIQFNSKNKIARVITCPEYIIQHVSSCPGYTWTDGTTYNTTTNLPIQTLTNNQGCDSVIYLNLIIQPTYDTTITLLNYSNSYTWSANGNTYYQSGTYTDTLTTILGCDSIVHLNLMFVPSPEATETFNDWIPNGNINDIDFDSLNNRMILAGDFTGFKRKGSGTKILDQITGFPTDFLPASDFAVEQIVSDGSNGYFVIGQFNIIGDSLRNGIAHLDANYNVTSWNSNVLVNFKEIIIRDGYIFGRTYNTVNAIDLATGNVLPWTVSPYMGTYFYSMEYIGGYLYIGGDFTSIYAPNLAFKRGIVQINPATGIATTWSAFSSGTPTVYSIHADNDKLYVGGNFTTFSGWSRNRIARATVSGSTVTVDSWNPNANGEIYDIETSNTKVLVLGAFTTIAGNSRQGVALMNKLNTTLHNFNPGPGLTNSPDYTKAKFLNGNLYLVFDGLDVTIGTNKRSYIASFDTVNFNLRSWVVNPNSNAFLSVANGNLFASGNYTTIGYVEKTMIAAVDPNTNDILNWGSSINGTEVKQVTIAGNKLFVSGNIIYNSGSYYNGIQIFNLSSGAIISSPEQINGSGYLLDYNDGYIYTSRFFGDITSPPDLSLSRIDTATLNFDMTFNPSIESTVNLNYDFVTDCEFVDSLVYFSGYFNLVQGQQRNGVACLDLNNLQLTPMSVTLPTNTSQIYIESNGDDLIILGSYFLINSQPRSFLSSVNRFNGNLNSWSPNFNQPLVTGYIFNSLEIKDNFVYVGGDFNYGSQIQRYGLSSFSLNNNSPASLTLSPFSFVNDLCFSNNRLHIVGDLTSSNNSGLSEKYKVFDICNIEINQFDTTYNSTNYMWNGILCQQSGLYYHTADNPIGCDSNYILHLIILPAIEITQTLVQCNSFTWPINGFTYSSTGVYYDTSYNTILADTNYTLNLTIVNEYTTSENQVNCSSYTWPINNTIYFNSGVYVDTIQSIDGCDSIITLNLTLLQPSYGIDTQTACDSLTWIDGITYYSNNISATHIIPNSAGCDSIITLNLTILQPTNSIDSYTVCDSLTWMDGITYYANNTTATHIIPNAAGCDSIITLNLTLLQPSYGIDTQTACDSLIWIDGITYYSNNTTATHIIPNSAGCDSIITLNLTILQPTNSIDSYTVCDSLTWMDGITYYSNNTTATHIIPNAAGCDSIITLNLTLLQPSYGIDTQIACDSLTWIDGITYYSNNTTAIHIIPNSAGCDSIITLNLTIIPSQPLVLENSFSLPSDANNCIGQAAITVSGNADFELTIDNGSQIVTTSGYSVLDNLCPGVHDLKITDNCGDSLHAALVIPVDSNYVYNNPYLDSMAVDSLGATLINCTIYYNSIDTAYIDSIWSVGNVVNVVWNIVDSSGSNYDTSSYVLNNGNGVYLLQLSVFCPTKALGDYFTVTEAIYFENGNVYVAGIGEKELNHIAIHPNPTNDYVSITSATDEIKRIVIYDLYGKELQNEVQNGSTYLISLNDKPTGIYLFKITTTNGQVTKRVVKQ